MPLFTSADLSIKGPEFSVEVSGALPGGREVKAGLALGVLVETIIEIAAQPVKAIVIDFKKSMAEVEVIQDKIDKKVRAIKFRNIAEVYNEAMLKADEIWYFDEEMKEDYISTLRQDYKHQFKKLLYSE